MMFNFGKRLVWQTAGSVLLLVIALVCIFYASIVSRNGEAREAFLKGDYETAQQEYVDLVSTFQSWSFLRRVFRTQYELALFNYAQLLYFTGDYRDVVEVLEQESAAYPYLAGTALYHRWMGNAFFRIAVLQEGEDLTAESLQTIGEEYKEAIRLDRDDWDAKHNYEFVQDIIARQNSEDPEEKETLQLLLGNIRLTSEQRRGELPEQLH